MTVIALLHLMLCRECVDGLLSELRRNHAFVRSRCATGIYAFLTVILRNWLNTYVATLELPDMGCTGFSLCTQVTKPRVNLLGQDGTANTSKAWRPVCIYSIMGSVPVLSTRRFLRHRAMGTRVCKPVTHPMPEMAEFVDALRAAFGDDAVRRGRAGEPTFFANENGRSVGTPSPTAHNVWRVDKTLLDRHYCAGCDGRCVGQAIRCSEMALFASKVGR